MDTSTSVPPGRRIPRRHSSEFRSQVIDSTRQPGGSLEAIALTNGMNSNRKRPGDTPRGLAVSAHVSTKIKSTCVH